MIKINLLESVTDRPTGVAMVEERVANPRMQTLLLALTVFGLMALGAGFDYVSSKSAHEATQRELENQRRINQQMLAVNKEQAELEKKAQDIQGRIDAIKKLRESQQGPSAVLQEIKPTIREEVTKEIQAFAAKSKPQPFILLVIGVPSLMTITTEGDTSKASALINERRFEIAMRRSDDGWKVTDFKDDVVVQRVVDRVMTQLPAIGRADEQFPFVKPTRRRRR